MSNSSNTVAMENHQAQKEQLQHMVDYVDADAVDFEPLTKSVNGAATTPHYRYSSSSPSSPSSSKQEFQFQSINIDQDVENNVNHYSYHNDHRHRGSKYSYSVYNQITNLILRCIPHRLKLMLNIVPSPSLTSSELSLISSLSICMIFFALVVLSGFISNSIGSLTQSSGVNVNQKSNMNAMKNSIALQNSMATGGNVVSYQGVGLAPPLGTRLPPAMEEVFANVDDLPMELMDTAIFWHSKFLKMSPYNIITSKKCPLIC